MLRSLLSVAVLAVILLTSGCDGAEPVQQEIPDEMVGIYTFSDLTFNPDASQLDPYNLLDTLDSAKTKLTVFETGQFNLSYAFKNGQIRPVNGQIAAQNNVVQLVADGNMQPDLLTKTLFAAPLILDYASHSRSLTREITMYTDIYENIPQVGGKLRVTLVRTP